MSAKSLIEWTEASWNPVTGCTKVSAGCKHCYAQREWPRLAGNPKTVYFGRDFTDVARHPERLDEPLRLKKPRRIFVNSMSDLFHESVPEDFILAVFVTMAAARQHTFQVLTKRAARMRDLLTRWRDAGLVLREGCGVNLRNVWLGVSVEDQATANERIPLLLDTPAAVRWISAEPLLGPVRLCGLPGLPTDDEDVRIDALKGEWFASPRAEAGNLMPRIDWVVAGGESGPRARPMHPGWARSLRDQCAAAGVPFLIKQWGAFVPADQAACDLNTCYDRSAISGWVSPNGAYELGESAAPGHKDAAHVFKLPKQLAGRLLDGVLHDEYPEVMA